MELRTRRTERIQARCAKKASEYEDMATSCDQGAVLLYIVCQAIMSGISVTATGPFLASLNAF